MIYPRLYITYLLINKNNLTQEISNLYNSNILYNDIIDYLNKPLLPTFSYIPYLSNFIFSNINLTIDGEKIDELNETYLYIYHNVINSINKKLAYYRLNPNNEKLLINTESKKAFSIYIEVPLYFSQITGLAFPLIANIYSSLKINFKIRQTVFTCKNTGLCSS